METGQNGNGNARRQLRSRREFAARLNISTRTLDRMDRRGQLPPAIQLTERIRRWDDDVIERFLAERTVTRA
jgi:predicted DNA-binding transcriptional regulator AlpA